MSLKKKCQRKISFSKIQQSCWLGQTLVKLNNKSIGDVKINPKTFVDDGILSNKNTDAARDNGDKITTAFELISLHLIVMLMTIVN